MPQLNDPDDVLIVLFKNGTKENPAKSIVAGRPISDDEEQVEIRAPGSHDVKVFPAHELCPLKIRDPYTGAERAITYAQRFKRQYEQFAAQHAQTRTGTPLDLVPFVTEAKKLELRGLNIYTVEALAHIDGQELKNLGVGGRELKNAAIAFIDKAQQAAPALEQQAELAALRARNQALEDDMAALKSRQTSGFENMTAEQLREYITAHSGHAPHGSLSLKVLQRMAAEIPAPAAAA